MTVGYTMAALAAGGIILLCLDELSFLHRLLRAPWLVSLGRISYGFYFFHYLPAFYFMGLKKRILDPHHLGLLLLPITFGYAYGIAHLSFKYLESPFLRLKNRLAPGHLSIPTGKEEEALPHLRQNA
jgi:peptidoglycan/LPS O-acetylase OafA/YrhL